MSDHQSLVESFFRQFNGNLTTVTENGQKSLRDENDRLDRSTKSVRKNWLRRNAPRFGYEQGSDGSWVPTHPEEVVSDEVEDEADDAPVTFSQTPTGDWRAQDN